MIGRRTITGLAAALVPARLTVVVAVMALCAAIGLHLVAGVGQRLDVTGAAKLKQYAAVLEVMPVWLILAGIMTQIAARLLQAWDDFRAWQTARDAPAKVEAEALARAATDGLPVDADKLRGDR